MADIDTVTIYTDGGSRGNPGPAAAGFVITDQNNNRLVSRGLFLGKQTNNFAEYTGVIKALEAAGELGAKSVKLCSDSELLVRQLEGRYRVKSPNLKPLYEQCMELVSSFGKFSINHVYREKNKLADKLVNMAMDKKADVEINDTPSTNQQTQAKPLRIAVLLSGGGTTLLNILQCIKDKKLNAEIPLVISSRSDVKGVGRAQNANLNVKIIRKKDFLDIEFFSQAIAAELDSHKIDLVVQAGWLCLWRIPENYKNRVMNIHPALLPSFGGKGMWGHHVHQAVIDHGCKVSGCTVHFCTNEYDAGPIIVQKGCAVKENDTADTLAKRVFEQECIAYPEAINLFAQNRLVVKGNRVRIKPE